MNRNRNDHVHMIPTPTLPRVKRDMGVHKRDFTFQHGKLIPFYNRLVYPHTNLRIDSNAFIRMDTSINVPIDEVFFDTYYFFVPFRIIDKNFEKIMGYKPVYDDTEYNFPKLNLDFQTKDGTPYVMSKNSLFNYLGYGFANPLDASSSGFQQRTSTSDDYVLKSGKTPDVINPYLVCAYFIVHNQYFKDEQLEGDYPVDDLLTPNFNGNLTDYAQSFNDFNVVSVNRYHDIYSSCVVSPTDGHDVTIPMGTSLVPVIAGSTEHDISAYSTKIQHVNGGIGGTITNGDVLGVNGGSMISLSGVSGTAQGGTVITNYYADMNQATGASIQQLYLSMALFSLYDKRATFGNRLIEQIRGSFGLSVPDGLLDRAEYLGGSCQTLNNTPVINTADDLGTMRGNSATLTTVASFDKGFNEWGFVIGLCCTRVKHSINSGLVNDNFKIFDSLDLYWPEFANVGKTGLKNRRIFNTGVTETQNEEIFAFTEPYIDCKTEVDFAMGEFGSARSATGSNLAVGWTYQDIYSQLPIFSSQWLNEPSANVRRTLTGLLIPNATDNNGHQFICNLKFRAQLTMPINMHSHAPNITGRL